MNNVRNYCEVYYQPGNTPVFCYRSGLAVYEETFDRGILVASGYNAAGYPLNVLSNVVTRLRPEEFADPAAFNIEVDGQGIDYNLTFVDFTTEQLENGSVHAVMTLDSNIKPVRLRIHTLLDGTQMFSRSIEIENLSDRNLNLNRLGVLAGGVETMDRAQYTDLKDPTKLYSLGYFNNDDWGREGEFAWHDLDSVTTVIDSRYGRERYRHPVLFLRNNVTGQIYFSQIAWSGGCRYSINFNAGAEKEHSKLALCAEITSPNPMLVLRPGERFTSPEVHMGVIAGALDAAVNEMHAHVRRSVLNMPEADGSACLVGAGMGAEHDMSVETSKAFIRQFAEMGAEIFIIDAGWTSPLGQIDWGGDNGINVPHPGRYPNGISELSDYCHEHGMKFALWVEIERLGKNCAPYTEHPEWRACNRYGQQHRNYLDLTNPKAAAWAESELARIIEEYKLDLLRVDYNMVSDEYYGVRDTGAGVPECLSLRHFNAVYRMYQNLKRRFPNVIFENCAGGGGRTDLGQMKAFNHTWVTDWQKVPHSVMITNGMTMALPPERVDRLFAGMGCHEHGSFDAHMRNCMVSHMSLNVVAPATAQANPVQMAFVRHSVDIYKNFIRKFLAQSTIYHHTPEAASDTAQEFTALEVTSPDKRQGVIAAFTMACAKTDRFTVIPRGINAGLSYRVTLDNSGASFVVPGWELITRGIPVSLPASLASELVLYEAV